MATGVGEVSDAMHRLAEKPDTTANLLRLLAVFGPNDRFFFRNQKHVRLSTLVHIHTNYVRDHRMGQRPFLERYHVEHWVIVNGEHVEQHSSLENFNAYRARGSTFVALWRVATEPELVRVLERVIQNRRLQGEGPLRFPGTDDFHDVANCIYKLGLDLLSEARIEVLLPGEEEEIPPGTTWMKYGKTYFSNRRAATLAGINLANAYGSYAEHVSLDFVLPMREEYLTDAEHKMRDLGTRLGIHASWTDQADVQRIELFVLTPTRARDLDIEMLYRTVSLFYP